MTKILWLLTFFSVLIWSAITPADRLTWILEVLPAILAMVALAVSYSRFPLTPLLYALILVHCIVLMVGGHYTYAEVPWFDTHLTTLFDTSRNNYDKLGHFMQGLVPALVTYEVVIRRDIINRQGWARFFSLCFALAFSAFYELIEWWVALASGENAEAFLGTQGYIWDTQSDMFMAMSGAAFGLLIFARMHQQQIIRSSRQITDTHANTTTQTAPSSSARVADRP